jgi:predicted Zn-dependent peptidase
VRAELASAVATGITDDELQRAKGHLKGSLALSMEDTNSRMVRLGRHELTEVPHLSLDETVARIEAVTRDEVHQVAGDVYAGSTVLGAVGPFSGEDLEQFVR